MCRKMGQISLNIIFTLSTSYDTGANWQDSCQPTSCVGHRLPRQSWRQSEVSASCTSGST